MRLDGFSKARTCPRTSESIRLQQTLSLQPLAKLGVSFDYQTW